MAKSPVQVVLNSSDFIEIWDRTGGGESKDFFAGQDSAFVTHQSKLSQQLSSLKQTQARNRFSDISYAKVVLRPTALAKSHRPTASLFNPNTAPVVGAGDLGEIFVELRPSAIDTISQKIMQAETGTRWKITKAGKRIPNPSNLRSEVGAIEEITPYGASDKIKFSLNEALEWLSHPQTGGAYIVELFEDIPAPQNIDTLSSQKRSLFKSFTDGLLEMGAGLVARKIIESTKNAPMLGIRLEQSDNRPLIQLKPTQSTAKKQEAPRQIVLDRDRHAALLKFLQDHPLVRKIILPPRISKSPTLTKTVTASALSAKTLPARDTNKSYPKIGIVDGGVSDILGNWVEDRWGLLSKSDKEEDHGTFIAGLAVSGHSLNGAAICQELDGCSIIDLDILPKDGLWDTYYTEPLQFFKELESAVKHLKDKTGVRVFNFSLNIEEHVSTDGYSLPAKLLDEIAHENDVIFIISAGNTHPNDCRKEWPDDPLEALRVLASSRNDTIKKPAESYRNLSVSAVNPPDMKGIIPYALSNYSCRGPGIRVGLKPDLAHIGGSGTRVAPHGHGLRSLDPSGNIIDGCGTSYAAPNVAKTVACLDHAIEGDVSRESLMGLTIHHASLPGVFQDKKLKEIAKDLIGFGIPASSDNILEGGDNSITLVFANRIFPGRRMSFRFSWPPSLYKNGKCHGHARLTVVSTPPFDYKYGAEFVRVNIEGHLRQEQEDGTYKGRLESLYLPENASGQLYEKNQIAYSFKWSPIKVFEKSFPRGVGPSDDWKLEIEYLARDGETIPVEGVPFTALLTISDPTGKEPVFNDMRQILQAQGVQILDIKTAARILPRV